MTDVDQSCAQGAAAASTQLRDRSASDLPHDLARAFDRTTRLLALTTALASALTVDDVADVIVREALPAVDASVGNVYMRAEEGDRLTLIGSVGYDESVTGAWRQIRLDAPVPLAQCARDGVAIFLSNYEERVSRYSDIAHITPHGTVGSLVSLPLLLGDIAIGALGLRFATDRAFSEDEREYMLTLAGQCALALERSRLYDSERQLREEEHLHYLRSSRIEQALELSEERFRFAIEAAEIGVWHRNFFTGEHVWSDRCRDMLGVPRDATLSYDTFVRAVHPDDRRRVDRAFRHAMSTRGVYEEEYRVLWPDGSVHWIFARGRGYYDPAGEPIRYEGIVLDIDERKRIESALRDNELHLRLALHSGRLGSWDLDLAGMRFAHVSDTCKANFGLSADTVFEFADLFEMIHPDDRVRVRGAIDHALRFQTDYQSEYRCVWPDGSIHWIHAQGHPMFDAAGNPERMIGVTQDITDRKRSESELTSLYAREHKIAATLQRSLMMPSTTALRAEVASLYEPASDEADVGGDFVDAFELSDGRVGLVVGDVVGKGLKAASRTAEIKYTLRAFLSVNPSPARAVCMLNEFLCRSQRASNGDSDMLASLALVVLDPRSGALEATLAGLEPPLIVRANGTAVEMDAGGLPLCVGDDTQYHSVAALLETGDLLILATDGITEARAGKEFLGTDGLIRLAKDAPPAASLNSIAVSILEGARRYSGGVLNDDACILLARRHTRSSYE